MNTSLISRVGMRGIGILKCCLAMTVFADEPTIGDDPSQTTREPEPPFGNGFVLERDDVVAFLGGGNLVKQIESGKLEGFLTHAAGHQAVSFRDLSWQADTVYRQQRPRNFGTQLEMLERLGATVVVANFGQMEAMEGLDRLPEFVSAYEALLNREAQPRTGKIVLVTPHPFAHVKENPHLPDLMIHNKAIEAYGAAIRDLAKRRGWIAVDLSRLDASGLTLDGFQLTPEGHARWAQVVARELLGEPATVLPPGWEAVQAQIQHKNILWRRHWRPTNWAFVYGNRQTQPSSHDHRSGKPRWFPIEIDAIIPLIEKTETQIFELRLKSK